MVGKSDMLSRFAKLQPQALSTRNDGPHRRRFTIEALFHPLISLPQQGLKGADPLLPGLGSLLRLLQMALIGFMGIPRFRSLLPAPGLGVALPRLGKTVDVSPLCALLHPPGPISSQQGPLRARGPIVDVKPAVPPRRLQFAVGIPLPQPGVLFFSHIKPHVAGGAQAQATGPGPARQRDSPAGGATPWPVPRRVYSRFQARLFQNRCPGSFGK